MSDQRWANGQNYVVGPTLTCQSWANGKQNAATPCANVGPTILCFLGEYVILSRNSISIKSISLGYWPFGGWISLMNCKNKVKWVAQMCIFINENKKWPKNLWNTDCYRKKIYIFSTLQDTGCIILHIHLAYFFSYRMIFVSSKSMACKQRYDNYSDLIFNDFKSPGPISEYQSPNCVHGDQTKDQKGSCSYWWV